MSILASPATSISATTYPMPGCTGFNFFKTSRPILYAARFVRDALVQLTLDPSVALIEPLPIPIHDLPDAVRSAVIVQRDGVRMIVGFVDPASDAPDVLPGLVEDLQTALISRDQILAEPRCSIARMVWACRKTLVSPGNRVRILDALSKTCDGLSLIDLGNVVWGPEDPIDAILALACAGHLAIGVSQPVTSETVVRRMRHSA